MTVRTYGFSACKGGCGRMVKMRGWARGTRTFQLKGICRKCARKHNFAARVRWKERRERKAKEAQHGSEVT